jgi:hypothetical protein
MWAAHEETADGLSLSEKRHGEIAGVGIAVEARLVGETRMP